MNDQDREAEAPGIVLLEVSAELMLEAQVLPWRGRGNIVASVGVALLDFAKVR